MQGYPDCAMLSREEEMQFQWHSLGLCFNSECQLPAGPEGRLTDATSRPGGMSPYPSMALESMIPPCLEKEHY